ncbi:hypothetical protein Rsub_07387 [Raphidocelis subcapitata]|uniref:Uncharacterized protein n=1 Tax=Raphidocelis subcapitata TaxID=307507 RepID=A0A2V0P450_9CHLO|nr:hypothetical protein Rsub_07387 [Raphidocelis subcapitata]|eukprot:GBF94651.1 hypothetical protein Rsub_07387 [Raphidocelis subcapitata]
MAEPSPPEAASRAPRGAPGAAPSWASFKGLQIENPTTDEALHAEEPCVQPFPTATPQEVEASLQRELDKLAAAPGGTKPS